MLKRLSTFENEREKMRRISGRICIDWPILAGPISFRVQGEAKPDLSIGNLISANGCVAATG